MPGRGLLSCALLMLVGCRRDGSEGPAPPASAVASAEPGDASCDRIGAMSVCSEYTKAALASGATRLGTTCKRLGGSWNPDHCPNTAVLGTCTMSTGELRKLYASGAMAFTETTAPKECEALKGRWSISR